MRKECHKNFHFIYGKGSNTKEQFEEWLPGIKFNISNGLYDIPIARRVYCPEDDKVYSSVYVLCRECNYNPNSIYEVCNHAKRKRKNGSYANHYTYKGKHYFWYDEYLAMSEEEFQYYMSLGGRPRKQVPK